MFDNKLLKGNVTVLGQIQVSYFVLDPTEHDFPELIRQWFKGMPFSVL
jgi:hypothetical protein